MDTTWGCFGFVARRNRLIATYLPQPKRNIKRQITECFPDAEESFDLMPRFRQKVEHYFEGQPVRFEVDVDIAHLPPFRQTILELCRKIPYGRTASYVDLARAAGKPGAARAVGGAMANNPLPLVVPCHRVLRADGTLGGFSSRLGVTEKERLLRLEGGVSADESASRAAEQTVVDGSSRRSRGQRSKAPIA